MAPDVTGATKMVANLETKKHTEEEKWAVENTWTSDRCYSSRKSDPGLSEVFPIERYFYYG